MTHRERLLYEISGLEEMLAAISPDRVLERMGLDVRLEDLRAELNRLPPEEPLQGSPVRARVVGPWEVEFFERQREVWDSVRCITRPVGGRPRAWAAFVGGFKLCLEKDETGSFTACCVGLLGRRPVEATTVAEAQAASLTMVRDELARLAAGVTAHLEAS